MEMRTNWRINEMQTRWAQRRQNIKRNTNEAIAAKRALLYDRCAELEQRCKDEQRRLREAFDEEVASMTEKMDEQLLAISIESDSYMHDFRNYVAGLPEADRIAYAEGKKGGEQ